MPNTANTDDQTTLIVQPTLEQHNQILQSEIKQLRERGTFLEKENDFLEKLIILQHKNIEGMQAEHQVHIGKLQKAHRAEMNAMEKDYKARLELAAALNPVKTRRVRKKARIQEKPPVLKKRRLGKKQAVQKNPPIVQSEEAFTPTPTSVTSRFDATLFPQGLKPGHESGLEHAQPVPFADSRSSNPATQVLTQPVAPSAIAPLQGLELGYVPEPARTPIPRPKAVRFGEGHLFNPALTQTQTQTQTQPTAHNPAAQLQAERLQQQQQATATAIAHQQQYVVWPNAVPLLSYASYLVATQAQAQPNTILRQGTPTPRGLVSRQRAAVIGGQQPSPSLLPGYVLPPPGYALPPLPLAQPPFSLPQFNRAAVEIAGMGESVQPTPAAARLPGAAATHSAGQKEAPAPGGMTPQFTLKRKHARLPHSEKSKKARTAAATQPGSAL